MAMSTQPEDASIEVTFATFMDLFDRFFAVDSPYPGELNDGFLEWHRKSGELDWHEFYRLDLPGLNQKRMS